MDATTTRKSILDRLLSLFAEVKAGEARQLLLLLVNVFAILFAYYILKSVREGLLTGGFFGLSSTNTKVAVAGVSAGMLFLVVPFYSYLVNRLSRIKLLNVSMGFVLISLMLFFVLGRAGVRVGAAFYLWLSVVNVFLIAQFWSYANDLYTQEAGKRLFAVIAIGGSAGAIVGAQVARAYGKHTYELLIVAAGLLVVAGALYNLVERTLTEVGDEEVVATSDSDDGAASKQGGFGLVFRSRYLLLIAAMIMLTNIVNTTGEFVLRAAFDEVAETEHPDSEFENISDDKERAAARDHARGAVVTALYGSFFFWVNLLGFLLQAFFVSRIFKHFGVRTALFILPVIALGGYALIGVVGAIFVVRLAKTAENATDYSLQNTVKQALFLPTTRDEKYKAKAAIDTFFVRGGDLLAALISIGLGIGLGFGMRGFALINVAFVSLWLVVTVMIAREHRKLAEE